MTTTRHLRDSRHLNKFLFTLSDRLFYEPLESHYESSNEYTRAVGEVLMELLPDWILTRDGFWIHVHPGNPPKPVNLVAGKLTLPVQGWKIHVSATLSNSPSILQRVARIALAERVPFKFALDRNILSLMSSKVWARSQSGKFITIYPSDLYWFKSLIERLYQELRCDEGPYVLSDKRYKDCRVLYYRFGGIERTTRLEITGGRVPVLTSPEGTTIPDVRTPYFAPPEWVTDPFPGEESTPGDLTLKDGKYLVKRALAFSNSGGVYLAQDHGTGRNVVIKEARAHTLMDGRGNDAIQLLQREQVLLELLRDSGVAALPLEGFHAWENFFLVEEYVWGLDVREVVLTRSPLMRVRPTLDESRQYYDVYKQIISSLARGVSILHEQGIVFGDLSANNLKIDPLTWAVRFVDFEGAFRVGRDEPTFLYTPGFKSELSIREDTQGFGEDLYSLAAVMLYLIFPISALASLRVDLFESTVGSLLNDIGWSETNILQVIRGLARNEMTCARACELLEEPTRIMSPHYADDVEAGFCEEISRKLGSFLLASLRGGVKGSLFPGDPFMHQTNVLSLGFGACGVLYALHKCGFEIPRRAYDWLERKLDDVTPRDLAPGLLTGASGMAWCLAELGFEARAAELMKIANESELLESHHSYLYGMAGVGMANLYLHLRTGRDEYLGAARDLAATLRNEAQENERGLFWKSSDVVQIGLGYGQSGVALFFLRLFQLTDDKKFLATGRRALEFDLSHGVENENGVLSFPCAPSETTLLPYLEEGSAGIAKVTMRYDLWDRMEGMLSSAHRKYATFAGLLYGLGSFVDVFTDAFLFSANKGFLEMAKRPISGIRDLYLIDQPNGLATPGDGLLRISCDYATGVAGVLRVLHRFSRLEWADFVLDEVTPAAEVSGRGLPGRAVADTFVSNVAEPGRSQARILRPPGPSSRRMTG